MKIGVTHLGVELTQRCNLNCSHCFRGNARNVNISREILEKVFDEIKFVEILDLSGGEVFLGYEQLKMLLEIAKEKETKIQKCSMIINGTIYDSRIYELLDDYFGNNYKIAISWDDFHDKSIDRIYVNSDKKSPNPDLQPFSRKEVFDNMGKHIFNEHCIGYLTVSKRLINNGRAVYTQTPHKDFEALGYYYNKIDDDVLLVGPMVFVGAEGYISDINSDLSKRNEQSLGNIKQNSISDLVLAGGLPIDCNGVHDFFTSMYKRERDFGTHQGDHLSFKDGKMVFVEYTEDEAYYKALDGVEDFLDRAIQALDNGTVEEFLLTDPYFDIYPHDLSQIDHSSDYSKTRKQIQDCK